MIHDLIGRSVKPLVPSEKDAGFHSIHWDVTNDFSESVSAGMYFLHHSGRGVLTDKKNDLQDIAG